MPRRPLLIPFELAIILVLVLLNGVFAGAEIALVTLRRTRLQQLLESRPHAARAVQVLRSQPERLLATVQIGITLVGAGAAAYGGASLSKHIEAIVVQMPGLERFASEIALGVVIVGISYLSLVLGELVPKSIALRHPETYALAAGRPLLLLSWIAKPLVWILTSSSNLLLRPFGDTVSFAESRLSPEELQQLVEEAAKTGALDIESGKIASRALGFGELTASDVMIPRNHIDAIPRDASQERIRELLLESGHTRMPVYEGSPDNIVGYISTKDMLALAWEGQLIVLEDILRPVDFVPESLRAPRLLKRLQNRHADMAIVVDEHGSVAGLVTLEDLVEELVGEIFSDHEVREELIHREANGSALVRGHIAVRDLNRELSLELPEGDTFSTIAGLCVHLAGKIPQSGSRLETVDGYQLEVVDASPRVVRLVRITPHQ